MNIVFADLNLRTRMLPLAFTRHCGDMRVGILTLAEKWEKRLSGTFSFLAEPYLQQLYALNLDEDNLLINPCVLPNKALIDAVQGLSSGQVLVKEEHWIAARQSPSEIEEYQASFSPMGSKIEFEKECAILVNPWDLFSNNDAEIRADFELLTEGRQSSSAHESATLIGDDIFIEEGASVINCSLNSSSGPIYIGKNATIQDGAFIKGPFALCDHATVNMGAKIRDACTVGPWCKVGGELNNSILFGFSNKGHDGFMGNSIIGEWCNLGADTNTSNLKNNYSNVKVWSYAEEKQINTNRQFCGLIMGDHSKCGINTMFNTGTVVGVSANIYGGDFPPKFIPSFSWGGTNGFVEYEKEKAYDTAQRVMSRRGETLNEQQKSVLDYVFATTANYRK